MMDAEPGFRTVTGLFDREEIAVTASAIEQGDVRRSKAGARHLLRLPVVLTLANDQRLLQIARDALGGTAIPFRATLFDKSRAANWLVAWHQDTALPVARRVDSSEWGPWTTKDAVLYGHAPAAALERVVALRLHLDASTATNGPLRVLPRTHTLGRLSAERIGTLSQEVTAVECLSPAGGVIVMRPLVVHASSKSRDALPRRVLHLEYAAAVRLADGVELAVA